MGSGSDGRSATTHQPLQAVHTPDRHVSTRVFIPSGPKPPKRHQPARPSGWGEARLGVGDLLCRVGEQVGQLDEVGSDRTDGGSRAADVEQASRRAHGRRCGRHLADERGIRLGLMARRTESPRRCAVFSWRYCSDDTVTNWAILAVNTSTSSSTGDDSSISSASAKEVGGVVGDVWHVKRRLVTFDHTGWRRCGEYQRIWHGIVGCEDDLIRAPTVGTVGAGRLGVAPA